MAAAATILGACGLDVEQILAMCQVVFPRAVGKTDDEAAEMGFNYALEHTSKVQSFPTLQVGETGKRIAKISSVAAAIAIASGNNPATAAFGAIFLLIARTLPNQTLPNQLRFDTAGRYCNVHLIDIGQPIWPSQSGEIYAETGIGQYLTKANRIPAIFCLAINSWVWQGIGDNPVQTVWRRKDGSRTSKLERIASSLRAIL